MAMNYLKLDIKRPETIWKQIEGSWEIKYKLYADVCLLM
jgi:hypothetical protein